jgi:hypothetical protein
VPGPNIIILVIKFLAVHITPKKVKTKGKITLPISLIKKIRQELEKKLKIKYNLAHHNWFSIFWLE